MAVPTHVQTVTGTSTSAGTVSASITATVGNLLIIQVTGRGGASSLTSVTVGGNSATKIGDSQTVQEAPRAEAWYYYVTSGSSQSVVATMGSSPSELRMGVTELSGTVASSPIDVVGTRYYASASNPSVSMTTATADCLLFAVVQHKATSVTWGASQTERWIFSGQGGGSTKDAATAGAQTVSATINSANWVTMLGFAVKGASGAAYTNTIAMSGTTAMATASAATFRNAVSVAATAALADSSAAAMASTSAISATAALTDGASLAATAVSVLAAAAGVAMSAGLQYTNAIGLAATAAMPATAVLTAFGQIPLAAAATLSPSAILQALGTIAIAANAQLSTASRLAVNLAAGMSATAAMAASGAVNSSASNYVETIGLASVAQLNTLASAAFSSLGQFGVSAALSDQAQMSMVNALAMAVSAQLLASADGATPEIGNYLVALATVVSRVYAATETAKMYAATETAKNYEARFIG